MISLTKHHATPMLQSECPTNSMNLNIELGEGDQITLFFDCIETWKQFRDSMQKSPNYVFHADNNEDVKDIDKADRLAEVYYHEARIRRAKREAEKLEQNSGPTLSEAA